MSHQIGFQQIAATSEDVAQMFQQVAKQLVTAGQLHQLFDLRLLQHRHELGLSLELQAALDDVPAESRKELENAYLDACREVGTLLLKQDQAREAWTYLRPAGEKLAIRQWLEQAVPDEDHADELIELALYEAIDAERGFAWLLAHRGTCNAITEFDQLAPQLSVADQRACAAVLVRHLHAELMQNIRAHFQQQKREVPTSDSISTILAESPDLLEKGAYHIDTSHLATTVRFSRTLSDRELVQLAIELADYGSKLSEDLQYPDQPPFEDLYRSHLLLLRATLGEEVDAALSYFRGQAEAVSTEYYGSSAIEAYLILLERVGRTELALEEYARLVPVGSSLSAHAPSLLLLAQQCHNWERYLELCEQRQDAVGYAAGLIARGPVQ